MKLALITLWTLASLTLASDAPVAEHVYRMPKKAALEWHLRRRVARVANGGGLQHRRRLGEGRLSSVVHVSRERLQTDSEEDRRQVADRFHLRDCGGFAMKKNSYCRHRSQLDH